METNKSAHCLYISNIHPEVVEDRIKVVFKESHCTEISIFKDTSPHQYAVAYFEREEHG